MANNANRNNLLIGIFVLLLAVVILLFITKPSIVGFASASDSGNSTLSPQDELNSLMSQLDNSGYIWLANYSSIQNGGID